MFPLVQLLTLYVLVFVACDLCSLPCNRGLNGHFLGDLHNVGIPESWTPEVVETRPPNSVGIETSALASAIPWMALMAVVPALLAVACWWRKLAGTDALDHEEVDLEVPTLEPVLLTEDLESSKEEEEEEDDDDEELDNFDDDDDGEEDEEEEEQLDNSEDEVEEEREELDNSDDDVEEEEEEEEEEGELDSSDDDDCNEEEEEKEILETEELEPIEEEAKEEEEEEKKEPDDTNEEAQLPRQHPEQLDEEQKRLAEDLEASQVSGRKLESLLDKAKDEIAWLRNEILDKDILIGEKSAAEAEMKRQIEHLNNEKDQLEAENQKLEEYFELASGRADFMECLHQELIDTLTSLENQLEEKNQLLRKRDDEERKLRSDFQQSMIDKDRELETAIEKANELCLRLKETEATNQVLVSEKDILKKANEDFLEALTEKERAENHQRELLLCQAIEAEKGQRQLGVLESHILDMKEDHMALQRQLQLTEGENSRLRELATCYEAQLKASCKTAAKLEDRNCELEKNLAIETQRKISLQDEVLMLKDRVQSLESILIQKESRFVWATEALNNETAKNEITCAELQVFRNWVTELGGETALIKEDLVGKCLDITLLRKELGDEKEKTQILKEEVQILKKWVSELGGQNTNLKEDLEEAHLVVTTLKNSLFNEKRDALHCRKEMENLLEEEKKRRDKLEVALNHEKELERERSEMKLHYQERLKEKDNEREKLREREEQLQKDLESAMHEQLKLESCLKCAEGEISSLKKAESINLRELKQIGNECERLREKCRMQEENIIEERKRVRDRLRTQEEELRNQDKYMLMALLHGTAQRNFHLQHIELERRNNSDDEEPENCVEIADGRKDHVTDEDLHDQVKRVEEEQYTKYCNAQREKKDYGKQWEVLTQMVEDLLQGDEQKHC
ncbi:trichohyalin-like [Macrobrachium nipponense]|uniref:trichohyalin-like n=1 Tax=Macrobrachium nipponense TaxID=159736 RepID=UPI0030C868E1